MDRVPLLLAENVYRNKEDIGDYKLVQSGARFGIWESELEVIVALRGTDFNTFSVIRDIIDDKNIAIAEGCELTLIREVEPLLPNNKPIVFTGHSLGGRAAICLAEKYPNSRAVSFNGGAPPTNPVKRGPGPSRAIHYHIEGDLISSHMTPQAAEVVRVRIEGPQWGTVFPHELARFHQEGQVITPNEEQASYVRWGGTLLKPFVCATPIPGSTTGCFV